MRNCPQTRFRYRNICRNINGMVEQKWHTDHTNSRRIENIFEMFVLRTTGQSRILRAKLLPSLEGRKNKNKKKS